MKIVHKYPPNIEDIKSVFPISRGIIFTYGDTIYNPDNFIIPDDLITHEETHMKQQGKDPDRWWKRYFVDQKFRLEQELEAYRNQYRYAINNYDKRSRKELLKRISKDLSRPLYGSLVTKKEAKKLIKESIPNK